MPKPMKLTEPAERLEAGRRVHEKEWPTIKQAARGLHVAEYRIYEFLKEYRDANGIVTPQSQRAKGPRKSKKLNGGSSHLSAVAVPHNPLTMARITELERQLAHAMDEVETLQKILMIVGRAL